MIDNLLLLWEKIEAENPDLYAAWRAGCAIDYSFERTPEGGVVLTAKTASPVAVVRSRDRVTVFVGKPK